MTTVLPTTPTTAPDPDSLAARQARTAALVDARQVANRNYNWQDAGFFYSQSWGTLPKDVTDQSKRRNECGLTPAEAFASYRAAAGFLVAGFKARLASSIAIDAHTALHPTTGEDMTNAPDGYTLTINDDGTATVSYAAPIEAAITS